MDVPAYKLKNKPKSYFAIKNKIKLENEDVKRFAGRRLL